MGFRGYVVPRKFFHYSLPTSVQNLLLRDYANKNGYTYKLPPCELVFDNAYVQFKGLLNKLNEVEGLLFPSIFNLPKDKKLRISAYKKVIKLKKSIHFVIEKKKISTLEDIEDIELIFNLNNTLNKIDYHHIRKNI